LRRILTERLLRQQYYQAIQLNGRSKINDIFTSAQGILVCWSSRWSWLWGHAIKARCNLNALPHLAGISFG